MNLMMMKFKINNNNGYDKKTIYKRYKCPKLKTNSKKHPTIEISSNLDFFVDSEGKLHITNDIYNQVYIKGYVHLYITFKNIYPDKSNDDIKYMVTNVIENIMVRTFIDDICI